MRMEIILLILTTFFLPLAFGQSKDNSTENDWSVETLGEKLFFIKRSVSSFTESKLFCKESFGMDILNSESGRKDLEFLSWKVSNGQCNESFWIEGDKEQCFSLVQVPNGSLSIPGTTTQCEVKPVPCNDQRMTVCQLKFGDDSWREQISSLNETLTALRVKVNQANSTLPDSKRVNQGVNKRVVNEKPEFLSSPFFQIGIPVTLFALILSLFILVILVLKRTGRNGGTRIGEAKTKRVNGNGDPDYMSVFYNSTGTDMNGGEGCVQLNPSTSIRHEVNRTDTFRKNGHGRMESIEANPNVYDQVGRR